MQCFNHEGLCKNVVRVVLDKDLCGRSVVLLQSTVLRLMLDITTDMYYIDSKCTEMKGFVHICTYIDAVFCTNCKS